MRKRYMFIAPSPQKGEYYEKMLDKYPLAVLKKEFKERNIEIFYYNLNDNTEVDAIIFFDYAEWAFNEIKDYPSKYKVLLLTESIAVCPKHYNKKVTDKFDLVFSWNDEIVNNKTIIKYNVPVIGHLNKDVKSFNDRRDFILINANKYSFWDTEKYSYRRKIISFFDDNNLSLDLYGPFWQKNYYLKPKKFLGFFLTGIKSALEKGELGRISDLIPHFKSLNQERKCYKGTTEDKFNTLSQYKYCICFENDIAPGNVSEKIFDCFFCGTIPIYLGASNIENLIPKETFIDMRDFHDFTQLVNYIHSLSEDKKSAYLKAGRDYIQSEDFYYQWRPEMVYQRIAEELENNI